MKKYLVLVLSSFLLVGCVSKVALPSYVSVEVYEPFADVEPIENPYYINYPAEDSSLSGTWLTYFSMEDKEEEINSDVSIKKEYKKISGSEFFVTTIMSTIFDPQGKREVTSGKCTYVLNITNGTAKSIKCSDEIKDDMNAVMVKQEVKRFFNITLNGIKTGTVIREQEMKSSIMNNQLIMRDVVVGFAKYEGKKVLVARNEMKSNQDVSNIKTSGYTLYDPKTLKVINSKFIVALSMKAMGRLMIIKMSSKMKQELL